MSNAHIRTTSSGASTMGPQQQPSQASHSIVRIRFRDDGPLVVEGEVTLVDAEGNLLSYTTEKPAIALCRCGASKDKPFCDGSHRHCQFQSRVRGSTPAG